MTNRSFLTTLALLTLPPFVLPALAEKGTAVISSYPNTAALQYVAPAGEVRQGEVIAVLDCTPLTQTLRELNTQVDTLATQLKEAQEKLEVTEAINREKLENAKEALDLAERALTKYRENDSPGAEVALKLTLHDAETEYQKQTERFNARDRLLKEGFIQKVEYDNEETRLKRTQLALEAARLKMDAFIKFEREERENQLAKEARKHKEDLATIEKSIGPAFAEAQETVEKLKDQLETTRAERDRLTQRMEQTIVRAQKEGRFVPLDTKGSTASRPSLTRGTEISTGQILGHIRED